jgi:lambda repressor-like predicted transcriptional regulator
LVTEAQEQVIRALRSMGLPLGLIAEQADVSVPDVSRVLNEPFPPEDLVNHIVEQYRLGLPPKMIASLTGAKPWRVYSVLDEQVPNPERQFKGRKSVHLTAASKLALRREHRKCLQEISARTGVPIKTLRSVLGME